MGPIIKAGGTDEVLIGHMNTIAEMLGETPDATVEELRVYQQMFKKSSVKGVMQPEGTDLVDPYTGDVIREGDPKTFAPSSTGRERERIKKRDDYMRLFGMDEAEATAYADNKARIVLNERTGRMVFSNDLTGETRELSTQSVTDVTAPENNAPSLWDMAEYGTGLGSGFQHVVNQIPGLSEIAGDARVEIARVTIDAATQSLIKAMSLSSRYPVGEQNRLKEELNIKPSIWSSPTMLRSRMVGMHNWLIGELYHERAIEADATMGDKIRENSGISYKAIERYLAQLEPTPTEGLPKGSRFLWELSKNNLPLWAAPDGTLYEVED